MRQLVGARKREQAQGFSLLELMIVVVITLVLAGMALPSALSAMHLFRLRNAATEFSGLAEQARSRSVQDAKYYSVYLIASTPMTEAFLGIKGSTLDTTNDPVVTWNPEVTPRVYTLAPSTTALKSLFLPTSTSVTVYDAYTTTNPITFSPMGLPCIPNGGVCNSASSTTPTAYWIFFQNTVTQQWEAVTVTPAGKIQKWSYTGTWAAL